MMKRAEFSFVWLFAIFVGAAILVLAIYGAVQTTETQRIRQDSAVAKEFSIITDPLQAGFADSSFGKIAFRQITRIYNDCQEDIGGFGRNEISVSTKSNIGDEWTVPGVSSKVYNKYIFSRTETVGDEFYVMSQSFELPYEVSDIIIMTPESYCFNEAPDEIIEEIEGLNVENIKTEECSENEDLVQVCFGSGDCEVVIYGSCTGPGCETVFDRGTIQKDGNFIKYFGSLMYAGIMSDSYNYDCNVNRLLYRTEKIAQVYADKIDYMNSRGCSSNLKADLLIWSVAVRNSDVDDILNLLEIADEIKLKNEREVCGTWD